MSIVHAVRSRLSAKVALTLAVVLLVLTAAAAVVITANQTRQLEEATFEKAKLAAAVGARQYGDVLERAIDSGLLTVNDAFDRAYVEIKGYDWRSKPKFHTRYDTITDNGVLVLEDKFLEFEDFAYAAGVNVNGYLPTHNTRFQKPFTGIPEQDLSGNRTKRIFDDPVAVAASRTEKEPSLKQIYKRDTGETMWDISSPIYVKGKHWGVFRVGVSLERIAAQRRALILTLGLIFAVFTLVTILTMVIVVQRSMAPVVALTRLAEQVSLGEELDTPIHTRSVDEIGQLGKAVDRLRSSMKAAIALAWAGCEDAMKKGTTMRFVREHFAILAATAALLLPAAGAAQARVAGAEPELTSQEREILAAAQDFAKRCAETMERWIAGKEVTAERLFGFLYYPIPRTDPPKFTTDWDRLSDRDIQAIEEAVLSRSSAIVFAVMVDKNGYLPTHNQRYSMPPTGNPAKDLVDSRTKRIFNDRTGLAAARNQAPFLIQRYQRDTGEIMADLSVPIFVRGNHWGAVRIGYRPVEGR